MERIETLSKYKQALEILKKYDNDVYLDLYHNNKGDNKIENNPYQILKEDINTLKELGVNYHNDNMGYFYFIEKYSLSEFNNTTYKDSIKVELLLQIKNTETNTVKEFKKYVLWDEKTSKPYLFFYTEGNFGYDCNRAIMFGDKKIEDEIQCGDEKYLMNILNPLTNDILYNEF